MDFTSKKKGRPWLVVEMDDARHEVVKKRNTAAISDFVSALPADVFDADHERDVISAAASVAAATPDLLGDSPAKAAEFVYTLLARWGKVPVERELRSTWYLVKHLLPSADTEDVDRKYVTSLGGWRTHETPLVGFETKVFVEGDGPVAVMVEKEDVGSWMDDFGPGVVTVLSRGSQSATVAYRLMKLGVKYVYYVADSDPAGLNFPRSLANQAATAVEFAKRLSEGDARVHEWFADASPLRVFAVHLLEAPGKEFPLKKKTLEKRDGPMYVRFAATFPALARAGLGVELNHGSPEELVATIASHAMSEPAVRAGLVAYWTETTRREASFRLRRLLKTSHPVYAAVDAAVDDFVASRGADVAALAKDAVTAAVAAGVTNVGKVEPDFGSTPDYGRLSEEGVKAVDEAVRRVFSEDAPPP